MYRKMVRACGRFAARNRDGRYLARRKMRRDSRGSKARKTAISARMRDFPPRRPTKKRSFAELAPQEPQRAPCTAPNSSRAASSIGKRKGPSGRPATRSRTARGSAAQKVTDRREPEGCSRLSLRRKVALQRRRHVPRLAFQPKPLQATAKAIAEDAIGLAVEGQVANRIGLHCLCHVSRAWPRGGELLLAF